MQPRGRFAALRPKARYCSGELLARAQADGRSVPSSRRTWSSCLSHVSCGRPRPRLHDGGFPQERTLWAGSTAGSRATCPNIDSWRRSTMVEMLSREASSSSRWLETLSYQRYPKILRRFFVKTGPHGSGQHPGLATIEQDREHQPPEDLKFCP